MRAIGLTAAVVLLCGPAWSQTPQPGTQAAGPGPATTTPAPVPAPVPGAPVRNGPSVIPEQIAPPGATAGPPNATPFSGTPSVQLPPDSQILLKRGQQPGGPGSSPAPNLSK